MIVAAPALVEAYAVLTQLPPPHRISPEAALTLLDNNFVKSVTVIALTAKSYEALLRLAPKNGVAGGRTYDAVIGTCAEQAKASTVLTFNAADFTAVAKDFAVVIPGSVLGRTRNSKGKGATPCPHREDGSRRPIGFPGPAGPLPHHPGHVAPGTV